MTRTCLSDPIPEILVAATYLDQAVSAHADENRALADELIRAADMPVIAEWINSLWGPGGPWSRPFPVPNPLSFIPKVERGKERMPNSGERRALLARDGFRCRFCRVPLVRKEVRTLIRECYPDALRWGNRNVDQHAALQAIWLQYDHLVPHSRGGTNELTNLVVTCAPCNYGRWNCTLDEVGLADPRLRAPDHTAWDGLERFRQKP